MPPGPSPTAPVELAQRKSKLLSNLLCHYLWIVGVGGELIARQHHRLRYICCGAVLFACCVGVLKFYWYFVFCLIVSILI
jgi:hypothetical protein